MNIQECEIVKTIKEKSFVNQRLLSEQTGYSIGMINKSLKNLVTEGWLDEDNQLTGIAVKELLAQRPRNAIILAAGYGMRMVPINLENPKALLEVHGEILIERIIEQLREVGIDDITIVVGFMKESFEYLIDKFGVKLVVNPDYSDKNNLFSVAKVIDIIGNTYIIPCDIWCECNPFSKYELYSWYMVSDLVDEFSSVRVNRKLELTLTNGKTAGNEMVGIAYLSDGQNTEEIKNRLRKLANDNKYAKCFWEEALVSGDRYAVWANVVPSSKVIEINTYEQLRDLDSESAQLNNKAINFITQKLGVEKDDITDICVLKKGMTNRSFRFTANGNEYIMRVPGEGTEALINRENEALVYETIKGLGICDDPVAIDPESGYKITRYLPEARVCRPDSKSDLILCMRKLRHFHNKKLTVPFEFNIFEQIEFYESLWNGNKSAYFDYRETKEHVLSLKNYTDQQDKEYCLSHIDAVPDNFLFSRSENEKEELQLTDWEYAGMQDPHVDIAMFCIYSLYDKKQIDELIDIYFEGKCDSNTRIKIYCYVSVCGLLWSNWCEYKRTLGVEFGEYSLRQYRYAKEYYRISAEMMEQL